MTMCRNRETNTPERPEVAMIPMPMTCSTDTDYVFDDATRKTNPATNSSQAAKANDYSKYRLSPSPDAGAVGGIDNGNTDHDQFGMYQALEDDTRTTEVPCEYEAVQPKRRLPKPSKPY